MSGCSIYDPTKLKAILQDKACEATWLSEAEAEHHKHDAA
jgi:hypothetical protein